MYMQEQKDSLLAAKPPSFSATFKRWASIYFWKLQLSYIIVRSVTDDNKDHYE